MDLEYQQGNLFFEEKKFDLAKKYFQKSAKNNNSNAYYMLGVIEELGHDKNNLNIFMENYKKSAELGNPIANYKLGIIYFYGYGYSDAPNVIDKNIDTGIKYILKSSQLGYNDATKFISNYNKSKTVMGQMELSSDQIVSGCYKLGDSINNFFKKIFNPKKNSKTTIVSKEKEIKTKIINDNDNDNDNNNNKSEKLDERPIEKLIIEQIDKPSVQQNEEQSNKIIIMQDYIKKNETDKTDKIDKIDNFDTWELINSTNTSDSSI